MPVFPSSHSCRSDESLPSCSEGCDDDSWAGTAPGCPRRRTAGCRPIDPQHPDAALIRSTGTLVSQGGVVIYPTETYYGLGGNPRLLSAVKRVYRIKDRAFSKPIPLIASDPEAVHRVVAGWPKMAERLATVFWPGPLTLILDAAPSLLPILHAHTGKIAVRISSHPVARALALASGGLLTATSANRSGQRPCRTAAEIPEDVLAEVDALLDAGPCDEESVDLPSTIVDLTAAVPRLVRSGCLPWEKVERVMSAK